MRRGRRGLGGSSSPGKREALGMIHSARADRVPQCAGHQEAAVTETGTRRPSLWGFEWTDETSHKQEEW